MAMIISDTFDFASTGYYYQFENGSAAPVADHTMNYIASNYRAYATYWAYSVNTLHGKNIDSTVLRITSSSNRYLSKYDLAFCFACAPLSSTTSAAANIIHRADKTSFNAHTSTFLLPKGTGSTVDVDITNVVKYAAENYDQPWGLYIIGGEFDGAYNDGNIGHVGSTGVTVLDPTIVTLTYTEGLMKVHNGSEWVNGIPYVNNGSTWIKANKVYVHNGSTWAQVR